MTAERDAEGSTDRSSSDTDLAERIATLVGVTYVGCQAGVIAAFVVAVPLAVLVDVVVGFSTRLQFWLMYSGIGLAGFLPALRIGLARSRDHLTVQNYIHRSQLGWEMIDAFVPAFSWLPYAAVLGHPCVGIRLVDGTVVKAQATIVRKRWSGEPTAEAHRVVAELSRWAAAHGVRIEVSAADLAKV